VLGSEKVDISYPVSRVIGAIMTHQNPHHERRWPILAVLGIAQLMVVLDAIDASTT
jgi:hypothetical protein